MKGTDWSLETFFGKLALVGMIGGFILMFAGLIEVRRSKKKYYGQ